MLCVFKLSWSRCSSRVLSVTTRKALNIYFIYCVVKLSWSKCSSRRPWVRVCNCSAFYVHVLFCACPRFQQSFTYIYEIVYMIVLAIMKDSQAEETNGGTGEGKVRLCLSKCLTCLVIMPSMGREGWTSLGLWTSASGPESTARRLYCVH